ncbi:MAG: SH3 domain-containing protein [Cyanobacteria bacterium P01_H01_bin.26]
MEEKEVSLKAKELELAERELALKEHEIRAKIEIERKGVLLSSPLLIAGVSTVFGTAIGAWLQGNANLNIEQQKAEAVLQLERQKFEFSLMEKALEKQDTEEAGKQLLFLVNSGVIRDLDTEKIRLIAETPETLPITRPDPTIEAGNSGTVVGDPQQTKNIRSDPSTAGGVVSQLEIGQRVTILESARNSDNFLWYKVASDGGDVQGWIASHLIRLD